MRKLASTFRIGSNYEQRDCIAWIGIQDTRTAWLDGVGKEINRGR